eukprot:523374-Pyramimonas_sp.AAC.1
MGATAPGGVNVQGRAPRPQDGGATVRTRNKNHLVLRGTATTATHPSSPSSSSSSPSSSPSSSLPSSSSSSSSEMRGERKAIAMAMCRPSCGCRSSSEEVVAISSWAGNLGEGTPGP